MLILNDIMRAELYSGHTTASIAKRMLLLIHKKPEEITEDDIQKASESVSLDIFTGGQIQEARQMLNTAIQEVRGKERKDVVVNVNKLNIENPDEGDRVAKEFIEKHIFPVEENTLVMAIVIYLPKTESAKTVIRRKHIGPWVQSVIQSAGKRYNETGGLKEEDFILIEFDIMGEREVEEKIQEAEKVDEVFKPNVGEVRINRFYK